MKNCNSCGKCCIKYSNGDLSATAHEVEYWEVFRPDIAKYVGAGENNGKIWFDPDTGKNIELCPWLTVVSGRVSDNFSGNAAEPLRVTCDIYQDRPEDCRFYPVKISEMMNDGCEMLEQKDFDNPAQAQKDLDVLMADSRPE